MGPASSWNGSNSGASLKSRSKSDERRPRRSAPRAARGRHLSRRRCCRRDSEPARAHALGCLQAARVGGDRRTAAKSRTHAGDGQHTHDARRAARCRRDPGAPRGHDGDVPRCVHGCGGRPALHRGVVSRAAGAGPARVLQQGGCGVSPVPRGSWEEVVGAAHPPPRRAPAPEAPAPARPLLPVPATTRAADLMLEMQRGGQHLAVVLDEFGGTAGLVTFDDLLNDLVGELFEPLPAPPAPAAAAPAATTTRIVEMEGNTPVTALTEMLGVSLGAGAQTVGGLLIHALGRIPRAGERFTYQGLEFDVLAASATRVERVAVRLGPVRTIALGGPTS